MSDPVVKQTVVLLKDKRPSCCFLDQVYDPDTDGPWVNDDSFPRVVPQEGGVVVERDTGNLYYVKSVDSTTYKSTLAATRIVVEIEEDEIKVISYGNDRFYLFVNSDHRPTQLTVSANFVIFGSDLVEYQLARLDANGKREVLSVYLDSDGHYGYSGDVLNPGYKNNRIPLMPVASGSPIKKCTNCHTESVLEEGETIVMDIFDNTGILAMTVRLLVRNKVSYNDLASDSDYVVGLTASALQTLPNGDFYLYQKQDPSHLGVTPRLIYSDGRYEDLVIDGNTCFCYGLEGFNPAFAGQKQKLLIKKFLGPKQYSSVNDSMGNQRFLTCEKWLTVMPNETIDSIKVSVMPIWNPVAGNWYLKYIAYSDKRDKVHDVTSLVSYAQEVDTGNFGPIQKLMIEVDLASLFGAASTIPYNQTIFPRFWNKAEYQKYLISDNYDMSVVYGVESSDRRRPVIHYDDTLMKYFIPTSRFRNKAALLDAFYYCANPPMNIVNELSAPEPTHFTIRALDNLSTLITTPIAIEQFNQPWMINRSGDPSMLVGSNVIVEFLKAQGSDYQILYGVPVDIYKSTTGYNTEPNDII